MYFFIFMFFSPDTSFLFSSSYIHQNTVAEIQSVGIRAWKKGCHSLRESLPREWEAHPAWLLSHPPSSPARVSGALDFLCVWFGVIISDNRAQVRRGSFLLWSSNRHKHSIYHLSSIAPLALMNFQTLFIREHRDILLNLLQYLPVMDLERFLEYRLLASFLTNNKCLKCIKVTWALLLPCWTGREMPVYWC